jgi:hypothetical protein
MKSKFNFFCQYYENYSDTNTPYWKPKGGVTFVIAIDSDDMFYGEENVIKWFNEIVLPKHNNDFVKYEYVSNEMASEEIIVEEEFQFV